MTVASWGKGCVWTAHCLSHALYEGDPNGGRLNQNLRTPPREPPASGRSFPWAPHPCPVPPLSSQLLSPRARPPSCQAEYLELDRLLTGHSDLPSGDNFRWPGPKWGLPLHSECGVSYQGEATKSSVHKTKSGVRSQDPMESRDHPPVGLKVCSFPSQFALRASQPPCLKKASRGPWSPGI